MLTIDLIRDFRQILMDKDGDFDIPKKTVLEILKSYEDQLGSDQLGEVANSARVKHFYAGQLETAKRRHETSLEGYRTVNAAGQSAMRSLFFMNGGASIAMSAFIGTLASGINMETKISEMAIPLGFFAVGTLSASIAFGCSYLSHFFDGYEEMPKWKNTLAEGMNYLAMLCSFGSIVFFGIGLYYGYYIMK